MCGTDAGVVNPLRRKITFFRRIRNRMLRLFVIGFVGNDNVVIFVNHPDAVGNIVNQRLKEMFFALDFVKVLV